MRVSTTRATSLRTLPSRSGVPGVPRKYLDATTLVASMDQDLGTSICFCSKTTRPSSPVMPAERYSQASSSAGSTPGVVKNRFTASPDAAALAFFAAFFPLTAGFNPSSFSMNRPPLLRWIHSEYGCKILRRPLSPRDP